MAVVIQPPIPPLVSNMQELARRLTLAEARLRAITLLPIEGTNVSSAVNTSPIALGSAVTAQIPTPQEIILTLAATQTASAGGITAVLEGYVDGTSQIVLELEGQTDGCTSTGAQVQPFQISAGEHTFQMFYYVIGSGNMSLTKPIYIVQTQ